MAVKNRNLAVARRKIERDIEQAEEDRKRKLRAQRLEFARAGIANYQKRRLGEAVKAFKQYIHVLEELNKIPPGTLLPTHFDLKKDLSELLMLSGVYWDLVKLYDRTKSAEARQEFDHYLNKYITFSKGMPYQHLCAEALRKYIASEKPIHREPFKSAYRILNTSKCFIASALIEVTHLETLPRLRQFREEFLLKYYLGRIFVSWYYRWGPVLSQRVEALPHWIQFLLGKTLDGIAFTWSLKTLVNNRSHSIRSKNKLSL